MQIRPIKNAVGIDIGASQVKIVQTSGGLARRVITAPLMRGLIQDGRIVSKDALAGNLRSILRRAHIRERNCCLALGGDDIVMRPFTLPDMPESAIAQNARYEISHYLSIDVDNYLVDYRIRYRDTDAQGNAQIHILVVAAPRKLLEDYSEVLQRAHLKPLVIDAALHAQSKLLRYNALERSASVEGQAHVTLDIGASHSTVGIFEHGNYAMDKTINIGLEHLLENASKQAGEKWTLDDDALRRTDLFNDEDIPLSLRTYFLREATFLAQEILRALEFYVQRASGVQVQCIYLLGGASLLPGMEAFLADYLQPYPVVHASQLVNPATSVQYLDRAALWANAFAATLHEEG
nr:pilus assembly protein PilM [Maliibacterium massiliense]